MCCLVSVILASGSSEHLFLQELFVKLKIKFASFKALVGKISQSR